VHGSAARCFVWINPTRGPNYVYALRLPFDRKRALSLWWETQNGNRRRQNRSHFCKRPVNVGAAVRRASTVIRLRYLGSDYSSFFVLELSIVANSRAGHFIYRRADQRLDC